MMIPIPMDRSKMSGSEVGDEIGFDRGSEAYFQDFHLSCRVSKKDC